jgi:hypothetical protein
VKLAGELFIEYRYLLAHTLEAKGFDDRNDE